MTHPPVDLATLRRPRLLITAAKFGLVDYTRCRDLRQALRCGGMVALPDAYDAVNRLLEAEATLEEMRRAHDAAWRPARHIAVLVALLAEWQVAYGVSDNVVAFHSAHATTHLDLPRMVVGG